MVSSPQVRHEYFQRIGLGALSGHMKTACEEHAGAIRRRILWVDISQDVRRISVEGNTLPIVEEEGEEEDPFGFGCGMDEP